jgi:PKD repeat protein
LNPTVTYNEAGFFNAKLWVANANGADSLILEDFVEVISQAGFPAPYSESFEGVDNLGETSWYVKNEDEDLTWALKTQEGYLSTQSVWI